MSQPNESTQPETAQAHEVFIKLLVETIGVTAAVAVAGASNTIGKYVMWLMVGFALIWLYLNINELKALIGKAGS